MSDLGSVMKATNKKWIPLKNLTLLKKRRDHFEIEQQINNFVKHTIW